MRPRYEQRFEEPRPINIPDWEVLEEVEALLGDGPRSRGIGPYSAFSNNPVALNVATVADMRTKVQEREAPLWAIRILGEIDDPKLVNRLSVKMHLTTGRREVFVSADAEDKASVDDMTAQLAELVRHAADRYAAARPQPAQDEAAEES